jgi:hypothetical protein
VGDVEVMMRVGKSLVIVLVPSVGRAGICHLCTSRRRVQRHLCSTRPKRAQPTLVDPPGPFGRPRNG